jgi:hypothetical protein
MASDFQDRGSEPLGTRERVDEVGGKGERDGAAEDEVEHRQARTAQRA